jgi:hypothetical protein
MKRLLNKAVGIATALTLSLAALPVGAVGDTVTYSQDTTLWLSGASVSLTILAGSGHGSDLTVNASDFVLPGSIDNSFTVRYPGPSPKSFTDGTNTYCTYSGGNNDFVFTSAHVGKTISISASACAAPSGGGGGGGGGVVQPYAGLSAPNGGQSLEPGTTYTVMWSAGGNNVAKVDLKLSTDGGNTYPTAIASGVSGISYTWTVPDIDTDMARVKVEAVSSTGSVLTSDFSDSDFSINGSTAPVQGGGHTVAIAKPMEGDIFQPLDEVEIVWSGSGATMPPLTYTVEVSLDGGSTWGALATATSATSTNWPAQLTDMGKIRVTATDAAGVAVTTHTGVFYVTADGQKPASTVPTLDELKQLESSAPASDSNTSGSYNPSSASSNTPSINTDKGLAEPGSGEPAPLCEAGSLIKASGDSVYFCGKDGKRYVFVNEKAFLTWYPDFSTVITISDAVLAQIPLGGNITYKPGVRMVKITTDPKVYAVARGGILRWVTTEAVAEALYGSDWNQKIDDVSDAFFVNYLIGDPITEADVGLGGGSSSS